MKKLHEIRDIFTYTIENMKNRYPCKIIKIGHDSKFKNIVITYNAVTKTNIRKACITEILEDRNLVEKFHPADCVRLGFIAAGSILTDENLSREEANEKFNFISEQLFTE